MSKLTFLPTDVMVEVPENTKILAMAIRQKVDIRYGCASCKCGTCAVFIKSGAPSLSEMDHLEKNLLTRMKLPINGSVRLACKARVKAEDVVVDLDFQYTYSPDQGDPLLED